MKILITGGTGLLGRALVVVARAAGHDIVPTGLSRHGVAVTALDARDRDAVESLVNRIRPDAVVNLVGERRPQYWDNPAALHAVNVGAATAIAEAADRAGLPLLHASTDYVFDGSAPPYRTDAPHRPLNNYGRTKSEAEAAVHATAPAAVIVRMPVLYGEVQTLDECNLSALVPTVLGGTPASVDHWALRRPALADDVARSMLDLLVDDTARGVVRHVTGLDTVTKYEMALAIGREVGVGTDHLEPDTRPSPSRPHDTSLDCSAGPELTGYRSFIDGLRQVLPGYVKLWHEGTGS